ncbi:hypothetical protein Tco_0491962 [Tanacetum coccineum]
MQAARDGQKSYADLKHKPMEFQVRDKVMLKVSPWKGVVRFGKRGKLNPRYVGPFKVLAKVGEVAYKLELPEELSRVHNTFHVSNLQKCYADKPLAVPLDGLHFDDKFQFVEEPVEFMDREVKWLKQSCIPLIKGCLRVYKYLKQESRLGFHIELGFSEIASLGLSLTKVAHIFSSSSFFTKVASDDLRDALSVIYLTYAHSMSPPPLQNYVPTPERREQAPPSPDYLPDYVPESDPEMNPEEDDDEDPEEDPVDYPADGVDDKDDEDEPSDDDKDDDMDTSCR